MATVKSAATLQISINLTLTEDEARALGAIAGYGPQAFIEAFYSKLGKHYLKPNEKDLIALFDTIRRELPQHLEKAEKARKLF